jgi:hypothetical protein
MKASINESGEKTSAASSASIGGGNNRNGGVSKAYHQWRHRKKAASAVSA